MASKKRTPEQLIEKARPILTPFFAKEKWCDNFFFSLIESAKQMKPNGAYGAAYGLSLKSGLDDSTAAHFAMACKFLAALRMDYQDRFLETIGE